MSWFKLINIYLVLCFAAILLGLVGFLTARFSGLDYLAPAFGGMLKGGVLAFIALVCAGLPAYALVWLLRGHPGSSSEEEPDPDLPA